MAISLVDSSYGKSRVRLTKVTRTPQRHELKELTVNIQLQGEFDRSYTDGDNSQIVATDTMKNTVYALAAKHPVNNIESFAKHLCEHFLSRNTHIGATSVEIAEELWQRIDSNGKPHEHAFVGGNIEKRVTHVDCIRGGITVESGIEDLFVLKTTDSEFTGFIRDEFTTLPEAKDRIFATSVAAYWVYKTDNCDFDKNYATVRKILLDVFAAHHSLAVQQTLFEMGKKVLDSCNDIEEIHISMPNQHRIAFDLSRFGMQNNNEIFVPTDEPYGLISATIGRSTSGTASDKVAELSAKR